MKTSMGKSKKEAEKENQKEKQKDIEKEVENEVNGPKQEDSSKADENQQTPKSKEKKLSEVDTLKAANADLNERVLRQMAEFDNFKKRTSKEKGEMSIYAKGLCVKEMLSVLDNFERALAVDCKDEDYKKGMEMILTQFVETLKKLDVFEIEAYNKPFNPEIHNAINQIENSEFGENTVCQVMQKGYKIGDKVIRHAMVVVANP